MRTLPAALAAQLASGVTTLCWCWTLTRTDGAIFGFTDHDFPVDLGDVICAPASARRTGEAASGAGFAPGSSGFGAILEADGIDAEGLALGLWDGAEVALERVDWTAPAERYRVWAGRLGEVAHGASGWSGELVGRLAALDRAVGRVFQRRCDAELGDARCGVDLSASGRSGEGVVAALGGSQRFGFSGLGGLDPAHLALGKLLWTSGGNAGGALRIAAARVEGDLVWITTERAAPVPVTLGDGARIEVGCDKRWSTCRDRFSNTLNFRGFPHMPGMDWVIAPPRAGEPNDGGRRAGAPE